MSVIRLGQRTYVSTSQARDGKAMWIDALTDALDEIEAEAKQAGALIDWESLELETETDYADSSTLMGPVIEMRITSLHTKALAVKQ